MSTRGHELPVIAANRFEYSANKWLVSEAFTTRALYKRAISSLAGGFISRRRENLESDRSPEIPLRLRYLTAERQQG